MSSYTSVVHMYSFCCFLYPSYPFTNSILSFYTFIRLFSFCFAPFSVMRSREMPRKERLRKKKRETPTMHTIEEIINILWFYWLRKWTIFICMNGVVLVSYVSYVSHACAIAAFIFLPLTVLIGPKMFVSFHLYEWFCDDNTITDKHQCHNEKFLSPQRRQNVNEKSIKNRAE